MTGMNGQAEAPGHTRESLFPPGWDKPENEQGPEAAEEVSEETPEDESLAEARADEGEAIEAEKVPEAALGRMRLNDFLDAAGVSMEEFYRDVYVVRDGKEVSVSAAWDEHKRLSEANDALLRERNELQEKVNVTQASAPTPGVSPEAQALMAQAQIYAQALQTTDWSQMDPATAANQKFDLQQAAMTMQQQAQAKQMEYQQGLQKQAETARLEAERQTRAAIPEWSDSRVYETEWREIGDMLHSYGVTPQETAEITDPRIRRLLRDHLKLRGEKQRIVEGARKVRKVSKTLGAGSRTPEKGKPTLKDVKQMLKDAKDKGATREEMQKMRLQVPLR